MKIINIISNTLIILLLSLTPAISHAALLAANTGQDTGYATSERTIKVEMVVIEQLIKNNRLGAEITNGQMYVLARDVVPNNLPYDDYGKDVAETFSVDELQAGKVRLRHYKRPRPMVLRANIGDILEIRLTNLLPASTTADTSLSSASLQIMGLEWLNKDNGNRLASGEQQVYRYKATGEGVYMMYSPNGFVIGPPGADSQLDYGLFGAVNVQPEGAEYYRSQVTQEDLNLATYRVSESFLEKWVYSDRPTACAEFFESRVTGLPKTIGLKRALVSEGNSLHCPSAGEAVQWELRIPTLDSGKTAIVSTVLIDQEGFLTTLQQQPVINYSAMYPKGNVRFGSPILNMLARDPSTNEYELAHSDLTGIITGPQAGRFPYYLNSPSFIENPATPDRRQPYREFTIHYHISPNTTQAFDAFKKGPLANMLNVANDGFAVNYGIAGIAPEIYANRINKGPQGINGDGVDLLFEEFFLSAWAVGDPAVLVDIPANKDGRATKAFYPDDPSNVYHSYMRDHVKFRVLNTGSVAPHVHHQHAHQWLHTPNSADGHYLDSQMINPGSTYTLEMTYNGSGNRNQTVGDSIFHCHLYPHFASGMWGMWRVHDVFEEGTELDGYGRPVIGARALPDGEIVLGTPIPALVPLPTLAMAPTPATAYLTEDGRRVVVEPSGENEDGEPVFENPGFPFFVPGIAGHRAPHPPMDFAWKENPDKTPMRLSAKQASELPLKEEGDIAYLDGGLPRNVVLGGEVDREFHTRWDFTKEVSKMKAMELPENGTAVEEAAMAAHATRTHSSHLPNGLPGNFILNGLPPAPGAPFAAPEVNDDGNSTFNKRRYKAAVIQTDVVFNKQGWHYPQQRFITLLEDVKDTIDGERPPEPFFFRAETGETVEFWHTNLVPNYYELDDFQVRTPTDILGQHIHLVKFDVTSSDGAGNGFNYEDGTFSPAEVRERIDAINKQGGLYTFDSQSLYTPSPLSDYITTPQVSLKISNYLDDYGRSLGKPPAGQDWNGAQTTIQRFGTDPLLNHQGEDRTLRTVFTHDHFGPSTHQQVGLYGAMLVEPSGTDWFDAVTGIQFPSEDRNDGGPTSWQAIIEGQNSADSFREFAIAMGDLQLAYKPDSIDRREVPKGIWFSTPNSTYQSELDQGIIPTGLSDVFTTQGAILSEDASVTPVNENQWALMTNGGLDVFELALVDNAIEVRTNTISASWADFDQSIWPPTGAQINKVANCATIGVTCIVDSRFAPFPTIISNPGGGGNTGIWVNNYRNEPLDSRLQPSENGSGDEPVFSTDPSFALSSILRNDSTLNSQPALGSLINPEANPRTGFRFPKKPLIPEGSNGVDDTDPYTPMLRAYANDKVEVRAIVGAVDSIHSFGIQGVNWNAEPSFDDSGFRDVQGMGISEHFEMLFQLPPAEVGQTTPVDRYYAPSTSSMGLNKGAWGIMRSYPQQVNDLASLKANPPGEHLANGFYDLPEGQQADRVFDVAVTTVCTSNQTLPLETCTLQYSVNGTAVNPLVLRAAAGDWIQLNLTNNIDASKVPYLGTQWTLRNPKNLGNISANASSNDVRGFSGSTDIGMNPRLISYDAGKDSGINVGLNPGAVGNGQTAPLGESVSYLWYAGNISLDENNQRVLTPVEFGGVNLTPSDLLLQASYGLTGALVIEPHGSTWDAAENNSPSATINNANGEAMFTEIVVLGNSTASNTAVTAGSEVRFRVLNPNPGSAGQVGDSVNVITVEGHNWPEEPYVLDSSVIADNGISQTMGTQQVTALESYNFLISSAGGEEEKAGDYIFYYFPVGPTAPLGTLTVTQ